MFGTILNAGAIVVGGVAGLTVGRNLSPRVEHRLKMILGVVTIYLGMRTVWTSINGSFLSVTKQIVIAMAALVIGNALGKLLRLQKQVNRLGEHAKKTFAAQSPDKGPRFSEGFVTCTILFCVGPMAIMGALEDGLAGNVQTLAIKSVLDGVSTMAFVKTFGIGPIFAAIPALAYQGTITLTAASLQPILSQPDLLASFGAAGGLLLLCVSVVILEIARVPLADYLPALAVAPALTWLFR